MKGIVLFEGESCTIPVTYRGELAWTLVDDDVAVWASRHSWCLRGMTSPYAVSKIGGQLTQLHVLVNDTPAGLDTDHVNGRSLDNRRGNLRSSTRSLNTQRRQRGVNRWRGVSCPVREGRWRADIRRGRRVLFLGYFQTAEDAATAYNFAAANVYGPRAAFNEPAGEPYGLFS